jgi:ABC-type polysaccharide/polyol phosphate export permease
MMYRDILLYGNMPNGMDFLIVAVFAGALLAFGSSFFKRLSKRFAEEV